MAVLAASISMMETAMARCLRMMCGACEARDFHDETRLGCDASCHALQHTHNAFSIENTFYINSCRMRCSIIPLSSADCQFFNKQIENMSVHTDPKRRDSECAREREFASPWTHFVVSVGSCVSIGPGALRRLLVSASFSPALALESREREREREVC